jgi:hypothetical protein
MTAWVSIRAVSLRWRHWAVSLLPIAASFVIGLLLRPFLQPMGRPPGGDMFSPDWGPWLARTIVQSVIDSSPHVWEGFGEALGSTSGGVLWTAVGAVVLTGALGLALLAGRPKSAVDVFSIGLIAIGLLAAVGAFRLRGSDPLYVYAARYLRFFVPIAVGMVVIGANWLLRFEKRALLAVLAVVVVMVSTGRILIGLPLLERRVADSTYDRLAAYEIGSYPDLTDSERDYLTSRLAFYQRNDPELAQQILDWHAANVVSANRP